MRSRHYCMIYSPPPCSSIMRSRHYCMIYSPPSCSSIMRSRHYCMIYSPPSCSSMMRSRHYSMIYSPPSCSSMMRSRHYSMIYSPPSCSSMMRSRHYSMIYSPPSCSSIMRSRGNVGSVRVYWELRAAGQVTPITPGEDFQTNSGFTDFSPQENQQPLAITPLADRLPETAESFQLVLTRLEGEKGLTRIRDGLLVLLFFF